MKIKTDVHWFLYYFTCVTFTSKGTRSGDAVELLQEPHLTGKLIGSSLLQLMDDICSLCNAHLIYLIYYG